MKEISMIIVENALKETFDKAGKPIIQHCIRVMESIKTKHSCIDQEVLTIALLHELLEDSKHWNEFSLGHIFNPRIVRGVVALTRKNNISYEKYIEQVMQNSDAVIVKIHDLIDNLDFKRLPNITQVDFDRLVKYHVAYTKLTNL